MVRLLVKATFKDYLAALEGAGGGVKNTLVLASAEPGMNGDLQGNKRATCCRGRRKRRLAKARLDLALSMLAVWWNAEILGEKVGIICCGMIAYLHFGEDATWAVRLVMLSMCGIFFRDGDGDGRGAGPRFGRVHDGADGVRRPEAASVEQGEPWRRLLGDCHPARHMAAMMMVKPSPAMGSWGW